MSDMPGSATRADRRRRQRNSIGIARRDLARKGVDAGACARHHEARRLLCRARSGRLAEHAAVGERVRIKNYTAQSG
jgi:hypothetical protein